MEMFIFNEKLKTNSRFKLNHTSKFNKVSTIYKLN